MVAGPMRAVEERLSVGGGIARFENDGYMRSDEANIGNAWFISTLWLAEYYIAKATKKAELARALELIEWCADHALASGVMSEQIDPVSGAQTSVSPLTWSHSTFVSTVLNYQKKAAKFAT